MLAVRKPMKGEDISELLTTRSPTFNQPAYVSPKIDGIRILCDGGRAITNSLKDVPNKYIRNLLENPALQGLDGELTIGGHDVEGVYRRTYSAFSRLHDMPTDVRFNVFDCLLDSRDRPLDSVGYNIRLFFLGERLQRLQSVRSTLAPDLTLTVLPVEQRAVSTAAEIELAESEYLSAGYEGLMYRTLEGQYKFGRATLKQLWLAKLKRFDELDAEIVGTFEQMENLNEAFIDEAGRTKRSSHQENKLGKGTLGGFVCRLKTGETFNVGIGMNGSLTDETRAEFWAIRDTLPGTWAKIGYQKYGMKGNIPRIPKFIALRDATDIG